MIVETSEDMFRVGVYKYISDATVTIFVGLCMTRDAVRRKTMEDSVIGKKKDWAECSRQKTIKK